MTRFRILALGLSLLVAGVTGAQDSAEAAMQAFAEADTNGDGQIDRGEFHARMVEIFFHADRDKDGYLTDEEVNQLTFAQDYAVAERDAQGRIALYEFLRVRFYDFDAVDADGDGMLSKAEVLALYQQGGVR